MKTFAVLFVCAFGMLRALPVDYQAKGKTEDTVKFNGQSVYHENGLGQGIDWSNYVPKHMVGETFQARQERSTGEQNEQMNGQVAYHDNSQDQGVDWSHYDPMHMHGKSFQGQRQKREATEQNGQVEYHPVEGLGQGVDWSNYVPEHMAAAQFGRKQKREATEQNGQVEYHPVEGLGQGVDWSSYIPKHMAAASFQSQRQKRDVNGQEAQMNGQVEYHPVNGLGQGVDWSNYAPVHMLGKSFGQRQKREAAEQNVQMNGQVEYHPVDGLGQGIDWSNYAPMHMLGKSFETSQRQVRSAEGQQVQMNGQVEYHDNGENLGQGKDWSEYTPLHLLGKQFESSARQARSSDAQGFSQGNGPINNFPFFHQQASGQAAMPLDNSFYAPGTAERPVNLPLNWSPEMNNKVQGRFARDVYYMNGSLVPMIPSSDLQQNGFGNGFVSHGVSGYPMPNLPFVPRNYGQQQYQYYRPTPGYFPNRLSVVPIQKPRQSQAEDWSNNAPVHTPFPPGKPIQNSKIFLNKAQNGLPVVNDESIEIIQINDDFPRKSAKPIYTVLRMQAIGVKPVHQSEYADSQLKPKFNGQYKHKPQAISQTQFAADVTPTQPANLPLDWSGYVPMHQLNQQSVPSRPAAKNPTNLLSGAQKALGINLPSELPIQSQSQDLSRQSMPQAQSGAMESKDEILGMNMDSDFKQHARIGGARGEQKVQTNLGGSFVSRDQPIWSN